MQPRVLTPPPGRGMPAPGAGRLPGRPAKRPKTLAELVDSTPDLPALPAVALSTHKEASRPGATAGTVATLVATDPALTARVLRLANSAYYGNARQVSAVADAVVLLGMKSVRNLCLLAGTYPWLKGALPAYGLAPGALLDHSLATAVAARAVADKAGLDPDAAFTAGLLHDLGKVALALWITPAEGPIGSHTDETRILGFDHGQTGGELARRWNLPLPLVGAIACHHLPCEGLEDAVHVGNVLAHLLFEEEAPVDPESLGRMRMAPEDLAPAAEGIRRDFERHKKLAEACA